MSLVPADCPVSEENKLKKKKEKKGHDCVEDIPKDLKIIFQYFGSPDVQKACSLAIILQSKQATPFKTTQQAANRGSGSAHSPSSASLSALSNPGSRCCQTAGHGPRGCE